MPKPKTTRAVIAPPGQLARIVEDAPNTLQFLQESVGGYITIVVVRPDATVYGNDEALLDGLPWNRWVHGHYCAGALVCLGHPDDEGEDTCLSPAQAQTLVEFFNTPGPDMKFLPSRIRSSMGQLEAWTGQPAVRFYECDENMNPIREVPLDK